MQTEGEAGVYVHVPFCAARCDYCDFAITVGADAGARRGYVAALHVELERVAAAGPRAVAPPGAPVHAAWPAFRSAFVGGGTPTLLDPEDLAGVLRHVTAAFGPLDEVTVEANPESVDATGLTTLVAAGLTRLSLGAQSADAGVLATLGRAHRPGTTAAAVAAARAAGVALISLDLIYGTPRETPASWARTLDAALALAPDHVSAYALTVEPGTPLAGRVRAGALADVDEDDQADRMAAADAALSAAGLWRYEVSNWARLGAESVHNRTYWRGGDWLALGAAAHGHWQGRRWWNVRPTGRYLDMVEAGRPPLGGEEVPTPAERRIERLLAGLRSVEGVAVAEVAPLDAQVLARLQRAGFLAAHDGRLLPTPAGLARAGGLALALSR